MGAVLEFQTHTKWVCFCQFSHFRQCAPTLFFFVVFFFRKKKWSRLIFRSLIFFFCSSTPKADFIFIWCFAFYKRVEKGFWRLFSENKKKGLGSFCCKFFSVPLSLRHLISDLLQEMPIVFYFVCVLCFQKIKNQKCGFFFFFYQAHFTFYWVESLGFCCYTVS